jgi:Uma2 family endonuclease
VTESSGVRYASNVEPRPAERKFTVEEVLLMVQAGVFKDDERVELVDGALLLMNPQGPPHAATTSRLRRRLEKAYGDGWHGREHCPVIADPRSMPEPDVAIVRGDDTDYLSRHPSGADAAVVVEVARTTMREARRKRSVYARGGFPVYLLVDVDKRAIEAHFDPRPNGRYARIQRLVDGDVLELPGVATPLAISDLLPR